MDKSKAARIAAKWWADVLRQPAGNNSGTFKTDMMINWARNEVNKIDPLDEDKISKFQECLEIELSHFLTDKEWNMADPMWGSYLRQVGTDWHPDLNLARAARKAGINTLYFPVKTYVRMDPNGVRVAQGYGSKIEVITE